MKIGILGYGSLGKQVHYLLKESTLTENHQIVIFDDTIASVDVDGIEVQPFNSVFEHDYKTIEIYVCLGYHHLQFKQTLINELLAAHYSLPNLAHSSVSISKYATLGFGNILFSGTVIDLFSKVGDGNVFYNNTCIAHDVQIGNANFFAPAVTICGNTVIGNTNFLGARTVIANNLSIQDDNKIGIGSVVTKNVASGMSGVGFPFRTLYKDLNIK